MLPLNCKAQEECEIFKNKMPYISIQKTECARYFPKSIFPSDNIPGGNFLKVRLQCNAMGPSAAATMD